MHARACSSASTPKATTSGTRRRARTSGSRTSTRCRGCTRCSRATACGRPTSSPTRWRPTRGRRRCCAICRRAGDCEIGAHHHAWETPPCTRGGRRGGIRTPSNLPLRAVRGAARLADRRHRRGRSASGPSRIAPAGSASPPRTSPRSSGTAISSSRASRRSSTRRTRTAPTSSRRRCVPYFLAYDSATRPGTSGVLEVPCSAALEPAAAAAPAAPVRAGAVDLHDQARAAEARHRARALAAAVVLVARRHDRRSRADWRRRRAGAEPALPLERSDRRRQSRTTAPRPSSTAFCDRLERFFEFARTRLNAAARDVLRVPRLVRRHRTAARRQR